MLKDVAAPIDRFMLKHGKDIGLLVLRIGFGGFIAVNHGWPKLTSWEAKHATFPDPLGVGHSASLALAIFGELVCGVFLAIGAGTRFAAVPAIITMLVAVLGVHGSDMFGDGEHALLYALAFTTLLFTGAGRFSLDAARGRA